MRRVWLIVVVVLPKRSFVGVVYEPAGIKVWRAVALKGEEVGTILRGSVDGLPTIVGANAALIVRFGANEDDATFAAFHAARILGSAVEWIAHSCTCERAPEAWVRGSLGLSERLKRAELEWVFRSD